MSMLRIYMKTYDANGVLASSWTEITKDVDLGSIGTLSQMLDNTEYDVGIIRNGNLKLNLNNNKGHYATPDNPSSLFRFKRADSLIKVTWTCMDYPLIAGFFRSCGEHIDDEHTIFEGLLDDTSTKDQTLSQLADFQVLGYESLIGRMQVPFSSLSAGQLLSVVIYTCLNQAPFTDFITVSQSNITVDTDVTLDAVDNLENKTVLQAFNELLMAANAVLYIRDGVAYVSPREPSASVVFTFYGQGSDTAIENIADLKDIRTGVNRVINAWKWKDTTLIESDPTSQELYGVIDKEIDVESITDTSKRTQILENLLTEFKNAKKELKLKTIMKCCSDVLDVFLLDRVAIDYPLVPINGPAGEGAVYGQAVYGVDKYAQGLFNLFIDPADNWKVMERKFDSKMETFEFTLRAV